MTIHLIGLRHEGMRERRIIRGKAGLLEIFEDDWRRVGNNCAHDEAPPGRYQADFGKWVSSSALAASLNCRLSMWLRTSSYDSFPKTL